MKRPHPTTAVYIRVSTADQRSDGQEQQLKTFCRGQGWSVNFYADRGYAERGPAQPQLERLLQDIRAGKKVERVVCYRLDRLGRSLTHLALILEELTRRRVPLICTSQGIDTSADSVAGKFQLQVLMAVAEFERGIIRERVKLGLDAARERGIRLGRPRTLDKHRDRVQTLRRRGLGVRSIARELALPVSSVHSILTK